MVRVRFLALLAVAFMAACGGGSSPPAPTATNIPAASVTLPATSTAPATVMTTPTALGSATSTPTAVATVTRTATPRPATATATPVATSTPTTPATGRLLANGPRDSTKVALTFDMGGRVEPAVEIMNWLIEHGVHATIFMTGAMAESKNTPAGRQVLGLMAAHPGQFALGNHSYSHPDFTTLTPAAMRSELERTGAAIAAVSSLSPGPFFRPPFGAYSAAVVDGVAAAGYPYTVTWDIDTIDWRPESQGGPTAAAIVAKVAANARGGSIVLMHLGGYNTLEALPGILAALRERGLTPVTLSEMVR
ncbi:MAG: polysaccharide deacetylase family protein [Dehalococcoidia bacterium]